MKIIEIVSMQITHPPQDNVTQAIDKINETLSQCPEGHGRFVNWQQSGTGTDACLTAVISEYPKGK